MGIVEALISADAQKRAAGMTGSDKIAGVLQRQNLKRLSKEFLNNGYFTQGAAGRQAFMSKYGLDDATMSTIQNVTNLVATGGVDMQGTKIGNNMISGLTGGVMYEGAPEDYTLGKTRFSGLTNDELASEAPSDYTLGGTRFSGETNEPLASNERSSTYIGAWLDGLGRNPTKEEIISFAKDLEEGKAQGSGTTKDTSAYLYSIENGSPIKFDTQGEADAYYMSHQNEVLTKNGLEQHSLKAGGEIERIDQLIYKIKNGMLDSANSMIKLQFPEMAAKMGMISDAVSKEQYLETLQEERDYWQQFRKGTNTDPADLRGSFDQGAE